MRYKLYPTKMKIVNFSTDVSWLIVLDLCTEGLRGTLARPLKAIEKLWVSQVGLPHSLGGRKLFNCNVCYLNARAISIKICFCKNYY